VSNPRSPVASPSSNGSPLFPDAREEDLRVVFETQDITPGVFKRAEFCAFWAYWIEIAAGLDGRAAPRRSDFDLSLMRDYLDFLTYLDVLEGGADFLYRVYGTGIVHRYGKEMTGRKTSEFPPKPRDFIQSFYRLSVVTKQPVYRESEAVAGTPYGAWARLCVPLSSDGATIDQLLNLAMPIDGPGDGADA